MADIDSAKVESRKIIAEVNDKILPEILKRYPGVKSGLEGASKDQAEFFSQLINAFIFALLLIYILIAVPTRSYGQPVVIMSVIPFGIIGAIIGHFILDRTINMLSMYGIIALTGVVVNDSLIMVDFVNKARARGESLLNAVLDSGSKRFRAILLTSLTTFFGVLPIYFETSLQAQFIIPMAISIGFGIMFATVITLFLIPSLYVILEDFKNLFRHKNEQQVLDDKRAQQAS
jgi:multidrug efflux pump subunit AcrB